MDKYGVRKWFVLELPQAVSEAFSIPVIASDGGGEPVHFFAAIVEGRADAVLAASVFHYRYLTIQQIKQYLHKKQVPVRLQ